MKKIKKSKQSLTSKFEKIEITPFPLFSKFLKKIPSALHKMVSHCVIIDFTILTPVIINFSTFW